MKRGRPLKFGRPAQSIVVTLPKDVLSTLRAQDPDVARAIVALVQQSDRSPPARSRQTVSVARTGRRHGLIVVDPAAFPALPGCELMRISPDYAFIALEPGSGLAELELAVLDRLAEPHVGEPERAALQTLRQAVRAWRRDARVRVYQRAIIVLEKESHRP